MLVVEDILAVLENPALMWWPVTAACFVMVGHVCLDLNCCQGKPLTWVGILMSFTWFVRCDIWPAARGNHWHDLACLPAWLDRVRCYIWPAARGNHWHELACWWALLDCVRCDIWPAARGNHWHDLACLPAWLDRVRCYIWPAARGNHWHELACWWALLDCVRCDIWPAARGNHWHDLACLPAWLDRVRCYIWPAARGNHWHELACWWALLDCVRCDIWPASRGNHWHELACLPAWLDRVRCDIWPAARGNHWHDLASSSALSLIVSGAISDLLPGGTTDMIWHGLPALLDCFRWSASHHCTISCFDADSCNVIPDSGGRLTCCGMFAVQPELRVTCQDWFRWLADMFWHVCCFSLPVFCSTWTAGDMLLLIHIGWHFFICLTPGGRLTVTR